MIVGGDVVVCVDDQTPPKNTGFPPIGSLIKHGTVYRVRRVVRGFNATMILEIDGIRPWMFEHWRFRKIEKADDEFVERMRRIRQPETV